MCAGKFLAKHSTTNLLYMKQGTFLRAFPTWTNRPIFSLREDFSLLLCTAWNPEQ